MRTGEPSMSTSRAVTVTAAVGVSIAVWGAARLIGVEVLAPPMDGAAATSVGAGQVAAAALVASLAGWGLLAGLERLQPTRASAIWLIAAGVVFVLSLGAPLTGEGITVANRAVLTALHLAVAVVLVPGLRRTSRRATARTDPAHATAGERS